MGAKHRFVDRRHASGVSRGSVTSLAVLWWLLAAGADAQVAMEPAPTENDATQAPESGNDLEAAPSDESVWVDPRPEATEDDIAVWRPRRRMSDVVDTGRGVTAVVLGVGIARFGGVGGLGHFSLRHRFERWTLGAEVYPAVLGRARGDIAFQMMGSLRGGVDLRFGSAELAVGVAPSRGGFRPGPLAPTAGLRIRLGMEDVFTLRMSFGLLFAPSGVKAQRASLGFHGLIFERYRIFSRLEGFFAHGIYSARIGVHYWLVGRGDSGSWSLGGEFGGMFVRYARTCEFGECSAVGEEDDDFASPFLLVNLEVRL